MISRAIDQSATVLINRRMKTERDVIMLVPVCSRVTGMQLHHSQGTNRAQAKMSRVFSLGIKEYDAIRTPIPSIARDLLASAPGTRKFSTQSQSKPGASMRSYCGVGDGVGEAVSSAADEVGAVVSTVEDGTVGLVAGAGNTAPLNNFDFCGLWLCNGCIALWL